MTQENLEILNNFIKKLNYEKYHMKVQPLVPGILTNLTSRMAKGTGDETKRA